MPTTEHDAYEPCRKVFDSARGKAHALAREFDDRSALDWLASAIPTAWTGTAGVYHLVRFVDTYLPRRNRDLLHGLYGIGLFEGIRLHWGYKPPTRKRRFADPGTLALHTPRNRDGTLDTRDPWETGKLPPCCDPSAPEAHVWSEPGFLLPEGNPLRYVRRLPWWLS